jgi:hypothetical protein
LSSGIVCSGGAAGEAAQVAEPQHGVDLVGDAASDVAVEDAPPGVAAEIGVDQGLGDVGERLALDRKCQGRHQRAERRDMAVVEAFRPVRRPGRDDAVHAADPRVLAEAAQQGDVVGDALVAQVVEDRELAAVIVRIEPAAQHRAAALD